MKQIVTTGIILSRTNFQEADRIVTFLTPDYGKVKVMAKGVRKIQSKLAGGIELFSITNLTFIPGRGDIATLISTRLKTHYGNIVKNIERTMLGYDLLKQVDKATEDGSEGEYFELLHRTLEGLNDQTTSSELIQLWFSLRLLRISGHSPNLAVDTDKRKLDAQQTYNFDNKAMAFGVSRDGHYSARHIKLLRLAISTESPLALNSIQDLDEVLPTCLSLAQTILKQSVRI